MKYQVIVTAGGKDTPAFNLNNETVIKHDIRINGKFLLEWAYQSYASHAEKKIVVLREQTKDSLAVTNLAKFDESIFLKFTTGETQGALCSALLAIDEIDPDMPLFIVPGDSYLTGDVKKLFLSFICSDMHAGTVLFEAKGKRWSYARLDENGAVLEMAEKMEISNSASTGVFFFRSGDVFVKAAEWVLLNNLRTTSDFYVSTAINYLVMFGSKVDGVFLDKDSFYVPMSTPGDIESIKEKYEEI
jgi:NDP-sugar pyrophosphorylase family protein